jgi:hypothetical protein
LREALLFQDSTINNSCQIAHTIKTENPQDGGAAASARAPRRRRQAEAKAKTLAAELGFTTAAIVELFKILGEQDVPEEKLKDHLVEIATHFTATRDILAACYSG